MRTVVDIAFYDELVKISMIKAVQPPSVKKLSVAPSSLKANPPSGTPKEPGRKIVTKKLFKRLVSLDKKVPGTKVNLGTTNPEKLGIFTAGKTKKAEEAGSFLPLQKKQRKKPVKKNLNLTKTITKSFNNKDLVPPPKTEVTQYLKKRGLT